MSTALEQSTAVHGVVSVHTSNGAWGTGVLVKDDIIITCAHVIQQETGITTCIALIFMLHYDILGPFTVKKQMGYQCSVLYYSNPGQAPDIAILMINNFHGYAAHNATLPIVPPSDDYSIGEAVAVISYGLLRPHDDDVGPLITKGAISKIVQHNNTPVMIQVNLTTAYA